MLLIDSSMHEYLAKEEIMRAKAQKVLKDTKFSHVDSDLNELREFIEKNLNFLILENKFDTKATPFNSIHGEIKQKGQKLCLDTLGITLKTLVRPDPILKSKETCTESPDPVEQELAELKTMYEHLEDQLKLKEETIERIEHLLSSYSQQISEKDLKLSAMNEEYLEMQQALQEAEMSTQRKTRMVDSLSADIVTLQKKIHGLGRDLEREQFEVKYWKDKLKEDTQILNKKIKGLDQKVFIKEATIKKLIKEIEELKLLYSHKKEGRISTFYFLDSDSDFPIPLKVNESNPNTTRSQKGKKTIFQQTKITGTYLDQLFKKANIVPTEIVDTKEEIKPGMKISSEKVFQPIQIPPKQDVCEIGVQVSIPVAVPKLKFERTESNVQIEPKGTSTYRREDSKEPETVKHDSPKKVKVKVKKGRRRQTSVSSETEDLAKYGLTSTDRRNRNMVRRYEHRFLKTSDDYKSWSPKATVPKEKFSDYINRKTNYYASGGSPQAHQARHFSPILNRNQSQTGFNELSLIKMKKFGTVGEKEFVAMTGKVIDFEAISE